MILHISVMCIRLLRRYTLACWTVVKNRSHGVILEIETRLEATSEELVRDRCTSDGVQKENFRPHKCTTVRRVNLDFRKHFVKGLRKILSVSWGTSKASAGARCARLCCSWRAMISALCDAVPFDHQSNVPIQQRMASQSTCRGARAPQKASHEGAKGPRRLWWWWSFIVL